MPPPDTRTPTPPSEGERDLIIKREHVDSRPHDPSYPWMLRGSSAGSVLIPARAVRGFSRTSEEEPLQGDEKAVGPLADADLLFWAFRYALGRMTYAVSDVAKALIAHGERLRPSVAALIVREIDEAEQRGGGALGMDCDRREWLRVRAALAGDPRNV